MYSLPLTGINIKHYCKNCLLSSCYILVIYLLSNITNFSVINLISYVGINSVFIIANSWTWNIFYQKLKWFLESKVFCVKREDFKNKVCKINC